MTSDSEQTAAPSRRDALDDIAAGKGHRHHLVGELADLVARRRLSAADLAGLIDARDMYLVSWDEVSVV